MASRIDEAFSFQEKALGLRAYRQQVLASNIANADTPNYKARDFDFASSLREAIAGRNASGVSIAATAPGHIRDAAGQSPVRLQYRQPLQASADGNTVEMDVERGQFADNALRYEAGLTFLTHQIKMMSLALQA